MRQVTTTADIELLGEEPPVYETLPVIVDQYQDPTSISFVANSETGSVKVSFADPFPVVNGDFVEQTNWDWTTLDDTKYPNGIGFVGQPIRAIYLTGAAQGDTLTVIQAGVKG